MIQLFTLGDLDLLDRTDGHQILSVLAQPKRVGFLAYLAISSPRAQHQRDTLLGIFWPDSTEKKARNALNQTVFVLRRALGQELIAVNGETGVGVDPHHLWCDVCEFEAALERGEKEEALDLYKGNFLEGFFLPGCLEFERWVDSERGRLRDLATGAVLSLSQGMESVGNPVGSLGWLRRAREWAVYDELVLCRQIELLLALGDRSGAVREYEAFARRLSVDLGLEPGEEVRRLVDEPAASPLPWPGPSPREDAFSHALPLGPESGQMDRRRFSLGQTVGIAGLAVAMGIGAAVLAPLMWNSPTSPVGPVAVQTEGIKNVGVLPLENATGDPELDPLGRIVADEIIQELATTGLARVGPVVPSGGSPVASGGRASSQGGARNSLRALNDVEFLVSGNYSERQGRLAFQARILDIRSGNILVAIDTVMGSLADPKETTERLKRRVAGALAMVLDPRLSDLAQVASRPTSFESYQILADGLDVSDRLSAQILAGPRALMADTAGRLFLRAAALDPGFTLPLILNLERTYEDVDSVLQVLRPLRDKLPRWDRAMLDYHLAGRTWDHEAQYQAMSRVISMSPDPKWRYRLAHAAVRMNRPKEAVDLLMQLESERDWVKNKPGFWVWLGEARLLSGDFEAVLSDVYRAQAIVDEHAGLSILEVEALARLGRVAEAVNRSIEILESSGSASRRFLSYSLPRALRSVGLEEPSRRVAEAGLASFNRGEGTRTGALAATLVLAGRYDEARQVLTGYEEWQNGRGEAMNLLAYMAAREGDVEEASRLTMAFATGGDSAEQRDPQRIMLQAETSAQLGDNAQAVRFLREAYDSGLAHGTWVYHNWDLRPLYGYKPYEDLMRPKG